VELFASVPEHYVLGSQVVKRVTRISSVTAV